MHLLDEGEIRNQVIGGKDGFLFLYGGAAQQFDHFSGLARVKREAVTNFETNTFRRIEFCRDIGAGYLNVVMPAKPVCCEDKLPDAYAGKIKSLYLEYFQDEVDEKCEAATLYPVHVLRGSQNFRQLDTHMNDSGQLKAANAILSAFGIELDHQASLRTYGSPGDLAVMLGRFDAQSDEPTFVEPLANLRDYDNKLLLPEGTNTGHLRVIVNPEQPTERRLLVCGDSFSVGLLPLFARYFHTVFYVRGPLFPYDVARRFAPTHVISSSTERYLAKGIDDRGLPGPASEYRKSEWYSAGASIGKMLDTILGEQGSLENNEEVVRMNERTRNEGAMNTLPGIKSYKTIILHKPNRFFDMRDRATTVVCGSQRGNTSAVAYALYNMGFFLGEQIGSRNYEDIDILNLLPDPALKAKFDEAEFSDMVAARNEKYERWGFKIPHASGYIPELAKILRDPVFVICFRNPAGVMRSIINRETSRFRIEAMLRVAARPLEAARAVNVTSAPALLIDTDAVIRNPEVFVQEISELFQLENDPAIVEGLSSPGYKPSPPRDGVTLRNQ